MLALVQRVWWCREGVPGGQTLPAGDLAGATPLMQLLQLLLLLLVCQIAHALQNVHCRACMLLAASRPWDLPIASTKARAHHQLRLLL